MLKRAITRGPLILMIINSIIGAGIFGLPSKIYNLAGGYSLLAFMVCAAVVLIFTGCFAEVSSRFTETGGPYLYISSAFGKEPAFVMGWLLLLSRMFNYAALINLMVTYLVVLIPQLGTGVMRIAIISILTLLLALVNHIGVKNAARFSTVFTIAKLIPLLLFIVAGLFFLQTENITVTTPPSTADFSQAVLLLIFAFGGFESVLINTGEVAEPRKNLPVALFTAIGVVALFYCAIQLVCMGTLSTLATSTTPVADAARTFSGNTGSWLIAAGAVISITGTLNVLMLSGSRLPYAFAAEKQLPLFFSYVHQRYRTPTFSLMAFALLTLAVSLFWSFLTAITVGAIIRLLVYLFVCVSLIRLRQKNPASKEHFRLKGGVLLPVLAIGLSIWLLSASSVKEIRAVFYCLLAGLAVYLLNRGFSKAGKQE